MLSSNTMYLYATEELYMPPIYGLASHAYLCTLVLATMTDLLLAYTRYIDGP